MQVVISHQLMLRAGMIRKLASGLYTWMPMGTARAAQGRGHRSWGDEQGWCSGGADARHPAGGALAGVRSLGTVRSGAAATEGSPQPRVLRWPDAWRGHYRPGTQWAPQLQAAAYQLLPDPDQIPRRDTPAFRSDAWPWIP